MTRGDSDLSADMLLVQARRRRIQAAAVESGSADASAAPSEILIAEEDAILYPNADAASNDIGNATVESAPRPDRVYCHRPLASVSLAGLAWSGPIDHAALQDALGCAPAAADLRAAALLRSMGDRAPVGPLHGEPALCVAFSAADLDFLQRALERTDEEARRRLASAALLPDSLSNAPSAASPAAAHSLADYRSVALVGAWRHAIGLPGTAESAREFDASAARLLSTMRAFLGET